MAITEKYVAADADGSGDGTSAGSPWTLAQAVAGATSATRVNVKEGTYTLSGTLDVTYDGTQTDAIIWRGYKTSPGDLYPAKDAAYGGRDATTGLLDTSDMPKINVGAHGIRWDNDNMHQVSGIAFYGGIDGGSTDYACVETGGYNSSWIGCSFKTTATTGSSSGNLGLTEPASAVEAADGNASFVDCDFICEPSSSPSNADGFRCLTSSGTRLGVFYCRFRMAGSATGALVQAKSGHHAFSNCVFDGNNTAKAGIFSVHPSSCYTTVINSTFYDINGGAIRRDDGDFDDIALFVNSIITDSDYAFQSDYSATLPAILHNCRVRDNANADEVGDYPTDLASYSTDTGTATSDFHSATGQDFRVVPGTTNGWNRGIWHQYAGSNNIGAFQSKGDRTRRGVPRTYHT
tara:strand:- start:1396 stop:2610 length:1215 start_codon:yes stop_codon:yes gene_type:complete